MNDGVVLKLSFVESLHVWKRRRKDAKRKWSFIMTFAIKGGVASALNVFFHFFFIIKTI